MNAAAALYVAGAALSFPEGVDLARASIDSGRALDVLEHMIAVTNRLARGEIGDGARRRRPREERTRVSGASYLDAILPDVRRRLAERKACVSRAELQKMSAPGRRPSFAEALRDPRRLGHR